MERPEEKYLAGCCGLFCGLCPRFQSSAPSRCLGCQLGDQHSYCSIHRCCSKKGHFTCADCEEYPCDRLVRVLGIEAGLDSFLSHKPALGNLDRIRKVGLDEFLTEQAERRLLVERLLKAYNEGRSMTFFCTAGALMPTDLLHEAIDEVGGMICEGAVDGQDVRGKAKAMRNEIDRLATKAGVSLKLRRRR